MQNPNVGQTGPQRHLTAGTSYGHWIGRRILFAIMYGITQTPPDIPADALTYSNQVPKKNTLYKYVLNILIEGVFLCTQLFKIVTSVFLKLYVKFKNCTMVCKFFKIVLLCTNVVAYSIDGPIL